MNMQEELPKLAELNANGDHEAAYVLAIELAACYPDNRQAVIAAAYACDRLGKEEEALKYYETAWLSGIPDYERFEFMIGFASTLRNIGREQDAVGMLKTASSEFPKSTAIMAFLALALFSAGDPKQAFATMLKAALSAAREDGFEGFERALREYQAKFEVG